MQATIRGKREDPRVFRNRQARKIFTKFKSAFTKFLKVGKFRISFFSSYDLFFSIKKKMIFAGKKRKFSEGEDGSTHSVNTTCLPKEHL
jgi:hypothetical protein